MVVVVLLLALLALLVLRLLCVDLVGRVVVGRGMWT